MYLFLCVAETGRTQSFITIDGSQAFTSFKFTDSQGNTDDSYSSIPGGWYSLGYRLYKKGFFIRGNIGMRKAGSALTYDGQSVTYNLQYCDLRLGAGYQFDEWRIKPYASVAPYYSFLIQANQNLNGVNYDIKNNGTFSTSDLGVLVIPGLTMFVSDYFSVYTEFTYLVGLKNIESSGSQTLKNKGYCFTLGIAATLTKSKPKWLQGQ